MDVYSSWFTGLLFLLAAIYPVYTGLVVFLIHDLTRPFDGALQLSSSPFQATLDAIASGAF